MLNITKEKYEMINGFIQHVFEEVQREGWKVRRDELLLQHDLYMECEMILDGITFGEAMETYGNDVDKVMTEYLYPVISNHNWQKAWMIQFKPELDKKKHLIMWDALCKFLYSWKVNSSVPEVKEILGLI
jgi:hypothetical protein